MAERVDPKLVESSGEHSPGAYLRQAREAADMSIAEVADALFLHPDKIEALESDTFDHLAAPTFVRGYLRGYARVLGLPSAPILEMYDRQGFGPPPLAPEISGSKQAHTSDPPVRLTTYAVGAVLVLLMGLWWKSQGDAGFDLVDDLLGWWSDATVGPPFPEAEAPATVPAGDEADRGSIATAPDRIGEPSRRNGPPASPPAEGPAIAESGPAPAEGAGHGAMTDRVASAAPGPRPEAAAGTDPAAVADPGDAGRPRAPAPRETHHADATDGPDATAAPGAVTPPSIPGASPPGTDSAPSDVAAVAPPVAGTAQPGLVLAFVHESWVEVFDHERNRLFFGLVQPGRVLDFDGPQPFDVLLGNSRDVRVAIDGEAFDHTPYVRHGVARFRVGAAPAGGADAAEPSDTVEADAADSREAASRPRDGNVR